jgi:hypothetical protein
MVPEAAAGIPEDLEHLRHRFEEFRNARVGRSPLPEALWAAAAELAKRYGVNPTLPVSRGRASYNVGRDQGPESFHTAGSLML